MKYGIKNAEKLLQDEISKFLEGEKLTDQDLKRLDIKVKHLLNEKLSKDKLKEKLSENLHGICQQDTLPKIDNINNRNNKTIDTSEINTTKKISQD